MITEMDFSEELLSKMLPEHKKILVDFSNNFLDTFHILPKEEFLNRINNLEYIGFPRDSSEELENGIDGQFFDDYEEKIIISSKINKEDINYVKAVLYHELIHAVSLHFEHDSNMFGSKMKRTGLIRGKIMDSNFSIFDEGTQLEEIMTEYYNTVLLQKEGIDFKGRYIVSCSRDEENFVEYHGTGYNDIAELGRIYEFMFGDDLLKAKFIDGNEFRKKFSELFDNTEVFKNLFNDISCKISSYSKFAAQKGMMDRYRNACQMFIVWFKNKHRDDIKNINDLVNNKEFETFLGMLVKTRNRYDDTVEVQRDFFQLMKEFEKDFANELFENKFPEENWLDAKKIENAIFQTLEKIRKDNPQLNLESIKYQMLYDTGFKGILLYVGDKKFLINYEDNAYSEFKKFHEEFLSDEVNSYSKAYKMDVSNASFATVSSFHRVTFIEKDGNIYNSHGRKMDLLETYEYHSERNLSVNK